ncbi:MAG TPA: hypothetical protein PLR01_12165 [Bacteroidales bacterium]|mgnify:CR=1 FL=1|nr:hypothetical protein [Bacteroidales bacterium]
MSDTRPEATITVQVDPYNPGEFFACCGLLELAHMFWGVEATGCFGEKSFCLYVPVSEIQTIKAALLNKLSLLTDDEKNPITPITLKSSDKTLLLNWWLDIPKSTKEKGLLKTWSGNQKIYKNLLAPLLSEARKVDDLISGFKYTVDLSGRLGVDARSSWNKIDAGFSPDAQDLKIPTYALIEFLSAIGLQRFRPEEIHSERSAIKLRYFVWNSVPLPVELACIASSILTKQHIVGFEFLIERNGKYKFFTRATRI